jgi:hypothetical protein
MIDTHGIVTFSRRITLCKGRIRGSRETQIETDHFHVPEFRKHGSPPGDTTAMRINDQRLMQEPLFRTWSAR